MKIVVCKNNIVINKEIFLFLTFSSRLLFCTFRLTRLCSRSDPYGGRPLQ